MSTPYVGEIRMVGFSFPPVGWALCNGQVLPISQNDTLFNLIGTTYGGDGQETFALPDLQGRVPMHQGTASGYVLGQVAGTESVTLTVNQIPAHSHVPIANTSAGGTSPAGSVWAGSTDLSPFAAQDQINGQMNAQAIQLSGGSQPHDNMTPFLTVNFIISLYGIYPTPT